MQGSEGVHPCCGASFANPTGFGPRPESVVLEPGLLNLVWDMVLIPE